MGKEGGVRNREPEQATIKFVRVGPGSDGAFQVDAPKGCGGEEGVVAKGSIARVPPKAAQDDMLRFHFLFHPARFTCGVLPRDTGAKPRERGTPQIEFPAGVGVT